MFDHDEALIDDRTLTAHHEAGHAVAALMRRGALISITIEPTAGCAGKTWARVK